MVDLNLLAQNADVHSLPEILKSQLIQIYRYLFEDDTIIERGSRGAWSDLLQLGVKDSLISEIHAFSDEHLGQSIDLSSIESILLDGYRQNKSLLLVAKALNERCPDFIQLFVFLCFSSADASDSSLENVAGGSRKTSQMPSTSNRGDHQEWYERQSAPRDLPQVIAPEAPALDRESRIGSFQHSEAFTRSSHPATVAIPSPAIEIRRDQPEPSSSDVLRDPSPEPNTNDTVQKQFDSIAEFSVILKRNIQDAQKVEQLCSEMNQVFKEAEGFLSKSREKFQRLTERMDSLEININYSRYESVEYKEVPQNIERTLTDYLYIYKKLRAYAEPLDKSLKSLKTLYSDAKVAWNAFESRLKDHRGAEQDVARDLEPFSACVDSFGNERKAFLDQYTKYESMADDLTERYSAAKEALAEIEKLYNIDQRVDSFVENNTAEIERFETVSNAVAAELVTVDHNVTQEIENLDHDVTQEIDSIYVRFMDWWRNCWLYRLFA